MILEYYSYRQNILTKDGEIRTLSKGIDVFGLNEVRQNAIANNNAVDRRLSEIDYAAYLMDMGSTGTFSQCGHDTVINHRVTDERELTMRVSYYNYVNGEALTVAEIEEQLRNVELSQGNTKELDEFCQFIEDYNMQEKMCPGYNYFQRAIILELGDEASPSEISLDELEEACQTVTERMEQESR